ncbi:MAG TPA: FtsX-like permease family protein [Steroidobacteraceae bacterium]|nr:FtsX-like permease family protein [Steroidobacteraceae bacterium]
MTWNVRPILSALLRNRTGAVLVALQMALALGVLVNAVYVVEQRVEKVSRVTGMDDENMLVIDNAGFGPNYNHEATMRADVEYLRSVPGVIGAAATSWVPLSSGGSSSGYSIKPDAKPADTKPAAYLQTDEGVIDALGVKLIAGRGFSREEILPPTEGDSFVPQVIITKAYSKELFGTENGLGRTIYDGQNRTAVVIGIIDKLQAAWVNWDDLENVLLQPRLPGYSNSNNYIVRTEPGQRDAVMRLVEEKLSTSNPERMIEWVRPFEFFKKRSYRADRNTSIFLVSVTTLLLAVAALGIFGLATFNVSTRTKQIGTRRAVGARRADIVRYFMVENWLITTAGIVAGCGFALGVGYWLSIEYELPRLDLYYLVGGVLALWALGLAAVWQPARRAAAVSPAVATRTV